MSTDTDDQQPALVPHSYQGALIQQRLNDGYINATAMCRAAGKLWGHYQENATNRAFLAALAADIGIPISEVVQSIRGGEPTLQGTWVHPQVAIHLGQWLSPEFAVLVSQWVLEWLTGQSREAKAWQQFQDRVSLVYDSVPAGYFCIFREIADIFAALFSRGIDPGTRMVLDISVGLHWSKHWREAKLAELYGERATYRHFYPNYFPQAQSNPQPAHCYPEDALPAFRRWMREQYVPQKLPEYLRCQVQRGTVTAVAANNSITALEDRERRRATLSGGGGR